MAIKYAVYWDNGASACGTFPNRFDTKEEAQAFADKWARQCNIDAGLDPDDDFGAFAEVIEAPELPSDAPELIRRIREGR